MATPRIPLFQQLPQETRPPGGIAYRFYHGRKLTSMTDNVDLCLGTGNCRVKPRTVRDATLLDCHDDSRELAPLSLVERDSVAKLHAIEDFIRNWNGFAGIQCHDTKCVLAVLGVALC